MIYIIRHGKTNNNNNRIVQGRTDTVLSNEGILQTKEFSHKLKETSIVFDAFYSSPLKRAVETLNIIMKENDYKGEVVKDDSLLERYFGDAEGISYDNPVIAKRICNDYYKNMEKNKELEKRVYDGILNIAKANVNKNVLIVSHSHAIKAFIISIINNYSYEVPSHNLNLNIFDFDGSNFKIIEVNKDLI